MPTISQTIKFRNQRRLKEQRSPWMRIGLSVGIILSLLGVIGSLVGIWFYTELTRDLPSIEVLPALLEPPDGTLLQPTRLYDRTYEHIILTLENPAVAGRQYLTVGVDVDLGKDQFSKNLVDATIAEFDPDFWRNSGFRLAGLSEGTHPTLAQRMVSNLVLDAETPSLRRNIRERLLAAQVTARFGREKLLEWYLNSAQYGELIYGADAAAHAYLGKSATELSLAEAAMLTAMSEAPAINPLSGSQLIKQQQEHIIESMLINGLINAGEAQKALQEDIHFQTQTQSQRIAPAFIELVLKQLSSVLSLERVRRGGYEIITSLDYGFQLQADCTSKAQVARLEGTQEQPINAESTACEAAQLLPTLDSSPSSQANQGKPLQDVKVSVVILDPHTGQILALVGDGDSGMDAAFPSTHPAGTILSPLLYLTAFTRGMSPATLLWDIPNNGGIEDLGSDQSVLSQGKSASYHGPVRLRMAFVNDYSAAAAEVLQQVGAENFWLTEKRFGIIPPEVEQTSGMTLDDLYSQPITLLEGVYAYAVLANQGIMVGQPNINDTSGNDPDGLSPTSILRVVGADGRVWLDWSIAQSRPIISPQLAYLTTNVLSDENARWTSLGHPNSLEIGRPAGAKVGSTVDGDGAWTVGYIPQLAIGVWLGNSQEETGGISVEMPAGLWHAISQYISSQMPVQEFTSPTGISLVQVCDPSGMLVSTLCPAIVQEVFLSGNEPTQVDNLYQKYYINRETGLLATIFTPSDMLQEKVYLVVPPQAVAWAKEAGLAIPPDTYDVIHAAQAESQDVRITSPQIFDHVSGKISFIGSATGNDFSYYRLQIGQGLNPQHWIQIGEDVDHPIQDGLLGTWDTRGLEGLYVVQLLVVRQDQRVDRAILQVTIDNALPQVKILAPIDGEKIAYQQGKSILIQVSASDNLVLERVEFYVDGELESTLRQPPLVILWPAQLGVHTLLVRAYDLAGNMSEAVTSFSVNK